MLQYVYFMILVLIHITVMVIKGSNQAQLKSHDTLIAYTGTISNTYSGVSYMSALYSLYYHIE